MTSSQPTPPPPYATGAPVAKSPILSILSMVFGILGVVLSLFLFGSGVLPGIAGVVLGFLGRSREARARGMWMTGIITGFVAIGLAIIVWVILGIAAAALNNSSS